VSRNEFFERKNERYVDRLMMHSYLFDENDKRECIKNDKHNEKKETNIVNAPRLLRSLPHYASIFSNAILP